MSLKKKLTMAVLTTTLGATIVAAGSFAYFTDDTTNTNNTFKAGTVDIAVNGESGFDGTIANLAPGDGGVDTFTLDNAKSSLDVQYTVTATIGEGADTLIKGDATQDLALTIQKSTDGTTWTNVDTTGATWYPMAAKGSEQYKISYSLPTATGNTYQGDSSSVQLTFHAEQTANNPK
ncbi:TasA family protein [Desulfitobacterium metallireducens]|uniref:Cell division protein FtsN n=1 Tax=Desulfitobacterium metallireducens DSM 15288 TaxID=871968 RepID=W0EA42_9FIRM|nr:TasA family protein [Desulfitobacterium metallireducens]AHF05931.1 cell division protein FtsN [Desulfitobacterium metallireducens DSM 15288]